MDNLWLILFWSGPIGLGIFLALFGVFVWLLAKADEIRKRTRAMEEELKQKGMDLSRESWLRRVLRSS